MNDVIEFIFKDLIAVWGKDKLVKVSFVISNNPEQTTNDILEGED